MHTVARPEIKPVTMKLQNAVQVYDQSRSTIYRLAAKGEIQLVKSGRSTLLVVQSMEDRLANLPTFISKSAV
jgi:hypothetical protein